jgi:hypothetical protein
MDDYMGAVLHVVVCKNKKDEYVTDHAMLENSVHLASHQFEKAGQLIASQYDLCSGFLSYIVAISAASCLLFSLT